MCLELWHLTKVTLQANQKLSLYIFKVSKNISPYMKKQFKSDWAFLFGYYEYYHRRTIYDSLQILTAGEKEGIHYYWYLSTRITKMMRKIFPIYFIVHEMKMLWKKEVIILMRIASATSLYSGKKRQIQITDRIIKNIKDCQEWSCGHQDLFSIIFRGEGRKRFKLVLK